MGPVPLTSGLDFLNRSSGGSQGGAAAHHGTDIFSAAGNSFNMRRLNRMSAHSSCSGANRNSGQGGHLSSLLNSGDASMAMGMPSYLAGGYPAALNRLLEHNRASNGLGNAGVNGSAGTVDQNQSSQQQFS